MNTLTCYMTNSTWYKGAGISEKVGIVVHSTGANNPYIKRYVQPSEDDKNYDEIIRILGRNANQNDWNHKYREAGVHAFIGKTATDEIMTVEVGPRELDAWGVGKGPRGSYNYAPNAHIQFEICEDALNDSEYFYAVMKEAQEYCAYLCKLYGWDETVVCSHKEASDAGYGDGHVDCDHWLDEFGKNMDWFRNEVRILLKANEEPAYNFQLLDMVKIKDGVTTYSSGKTMQSWVLTATLYVRRINDDGTITVSTQKAGDITGTVFASDLVPVVTETITTTPVVGVPEVSEDIPVEKEEPEVEPEVTLEPEIEPEVEPEVKVEIEPESDLIALIRRIFAYIVKIFAKK